jgi:glucose-6-phosphate isomerase
MGSSLEQYLIEAAGAGKSQLSAENPYGDIGFDGEKKRLGWVRPPAFSRIKSALEAVAPLLEGRKHFIFVGMGGSINGIKPLLALSGKSNFHILDNLDPGAIRELSDKLKEPQETLVISISKSGTTRETQLLTSALKDLFANRLGAGSWQNYFLWLSDTASFPKLDILGWQGVNKVAIQVDGEDDIGGRFSSPHTLIFLLPLFLILDRDFSRLENCWNSFKEIIPEINRQAYSAAQNCKGRPQAYFSPFTTGAFNQSFSSWIVQLFQESLGSKLKDLAVKTLTNVTEDELFFPLKLEQEIDSPFVSLISQMYFFQVFVAYYSAQRKINFVSQNFVEKYKQQMQKLEGGNRHSGIEKAASLAEVISAVKKLIKPAQRFIEVVLYFYPGQEIKEAVTEEFSANFPRKRILVFAGSDWNHQSYQAAFASKDTFFVLLTASFYDCRVSGISEDILVNNSTTLQVIAEATYLTLKDKSLLFSFPA